MQTIPPWAWGVFGLTLLLLVTIDLFAHRGAHGESHRAAVVWSVIWVAAGLLFNVFVWVMFGGEAASEYLAAYLIEKSLSLDNIFVFLVIFQSLRIPARYQHKVLFWGIFGALVFRAVFIFLGVAAVERFEWVTYLFGGVLLWAAIRIAREQPGRPQENKVVMWLARHLPVTSKVEGPHFLVRHDGRRMATPLLVALLGVEVTDIFFAVDSVPAAFAITTNRFILYTSNAFAILGLRALYVVLARSIQGLRYLHYGLAAVLGFAGLKMVLRNWVHIHPLVSVAIIVAVVGVAVWASVRAQRREEGARARPDGRPPGDPRRGRQCAAAEREGWPRGPGTSVKQEA